MPPIFLVAVTLTPHQIVALLHSAFNNKDRLSWIADTWFDQAPQQPVPPEISNLYHWAAWHPVFGGAIVVVERHPDNPQTIEHTFHTPTISAGLQLIANTNPTLLAKILAGENTQPTASAFLQFCLFRDIIYA